MQRFTDWLILCRLLPVWALNELGWGPDQISFIAEFIDRVAFDPRRYATDTVDQALDAAARLHPELAGRARRVSALLPAPELSEIWEGRPQPIDEPAPVEGFDIDRVLADL